MVFNFFLSCISRKFLGTNFFGHKKYSTKSKLIFLYISCVDIFNWIIHKSWFFNQNDYFYKLLWKHLSLVGINYVVSCFKWKS